MLKTWKLTEPRHALLTDNPHVENATRQASLSHMTDYAKDGKLLAVQYTGPEKAVKTAVRKYSEEKFNITSRLIKGSALNSKGRRAESLTHVKLSVPGPKTYTQLATDGKFP